MTISQEGARLTRSTSPRRDFGWQERAACQDEPKMLFFGPEGEQRPDREIREAAAKAICRYCPVRAECLDEALREAPQHGVWGGMSAEERTAQRRNILRRKGRAA